MNIGDNVEYQNELLDDYITRNYSVEPAILDRIKNLNRSLNARLSPVEISRNISWKPKKFEFENSTVLDLILRFFLFPPCDFQDITYNK